MLTKDEAIEQAIIAAREEYETCNIILVDAKFDFRNCAWDITLEVWEIYKYVWRVWQKDDGKLAYAFLRYDSNS